MVVCTFCQHQIYFSVWALRTVYAIGMYMALYTKLSLGVMLWGMVLQCKCSNLIHYNDNDNNNNNFNLFPRDPRMLYMKTNKQIRDKQASCQKPGRLSVSLGQIQKIIKLNLLWQQKFEEFWNNHSRIWIYCEHKKLVCFYFYFILLPLTDTEMWGDTIYKNSSLC